MRRFLFTVLFLAIASSASAGEKITVSQASQIATALRNLDGHMVIVKQNGADNTVMTPWDFGSASLRLRVANDLTIVDAAVKAAEDARMAILKEQIGRASERTGEKVTDIKPGTPEFDEYQKQVVDLMASPASGTQDLARIRASELKVDKNEIPVTVLSALKPIMDDDTAK